jgi:hypothetical protein
VRLTVRHYFDFGSERNIVGDDLVRPEAWDALRTRTTGAFALSRSREELERLADAHPEVGARARVIDTTLEERGLGTLASYGVGGALPEVWLRRLRPERKLVVTDYAPETVSRLQALLPDVEVVRHDLLIDSPLRADAHLFHRIDTELSDAQWRSVFARFAQETVVIVATEVADLSRVVGEFARRVRRRGLTRAGWLRTATAFQALWAPTHQATRVRFHDLEGWVLEPHAAYDPPR